MIGSFTKLYKLSRISQNDIFGWLATRETDLVDITSVRSIQFLPAIQICTYNSMASLRL